MSTAVIALIAPYAVAAIAAVWTLFLNPSKTKAFGEKCGKFVSMFGQKKIGRKSYETLESRFQGTVSDWFSGFMDGLDSDD